MTNYKLGVSSYFKPRFADTAEIELQVCDDEVWGLSFKERD
jgi:hypothetical protein